jgi:hypothetical protein
VQPGTLAVLDLRDGSLHRVRRAGQQVAFAEAMPGGSGAWVTCAGALLAYAFSREPSGSLAYEARCFVRTDLGTVGAAALVDGGRRLAVGNDVGELRILAPDLASRPVLVHDVLPAPAPPRGGAG